MRWIRTFWNVYTIIGIITILVSALVIIAILAWLDSVAIEGDKSKTD